MVRVGLDGCGQRDSVDTALYYLPRKPRLVLQEKSYNFESSVVASQESERI